MRDLVETVIGQVLQQDKRTAQAIGDPEAFKNKMVKALNDRAELVQEKPMRGVADDQKVAKSPLMASLQHGSKVQVEASDAHKVKDKELWDVSVKFEAIFFQQMMSAMRKTVTKSDFLPHGFAQGVQESMFDQAVAEAGSKSGSLGIAINIYQQLERSGQKNPSDAQQAIQEISQASDRDGVSMYAKLRGGSDGAH